MPETPKSGAECRNKLWLLGGLELAGFYFIFNDKKIDKKIQEELKWNKDQGALALTIGLIIVSTARFVSCLDAFKSAQRINWENRNHLVQAKWSPIIEPRRFGGMITLGF